ncbi:glycosyltransferase [Neobacillus sp. WH10]|uniref:glycosyltransferase family 2 protein n=1 Tax=Neobacillus sp. WH10 TaxID=3047873 RepID=UPI0024C1496C|nr:glycosyltransferase [Neobacillus sp. WH10]WHY78267.1 glycosyltransferase [Neobacillus sp. WH10]
MTVENKGVSIVVSTNKVGFLENIFSNFENQNWETKELIIILNNDSLILEDWVNRAEQTDHVTVYQLPQSVSLGACLNFGVNRAKYEYIAKFDDDDYYGPFYLTEAMNTFKKKNADIVGKRTYYMHNSLTKELRLRFPRREHRFISKVHGGTIMAKKEVFCKVRFANISLGEDVNFLYRCVEHGFKIYSTSRYNYTYIRRDDGTNTWKPRSQYLKATSLRIRNTDHFKAHVNRYYDTD